MNPMRAAVKNWSKQHIIIINKINVLNFLNFFLEMKRDLFTANDLCTVNGSCMENGLCMASVSYMVE
jgi:hypothetical protein